MFIDYVRITGYLNRYVRTRNIKLDTWRFEFEFFIIRKILIFTLRASEAAAQCIVIGPVCLCVCGCVRLCVCVGGGLLPR